MDLGLKGSVIAVTGGGAGTAGIIPELKAAIEKFGGRIKLALLYGSIARGEEHAGSDIDLMVVGTLRQIDLLPVLRNLESRFRREVNVTLFSPGEFHRKLASADHFLSSVMNAKTIPLKGSLNELVSWKKLLQSNSVHRHTTSRQELSRSELLNFAYLQSADKRKHFFSSRRHCQRLTLEYDEWRVW